MKKALVLYWSATGNTEKAAKAITKGLTRGGYEVTEKKIAEAEGESYFSYDLVCLGTPSINWHPPIPVEKFLKTQFAEHKKEGRVVPGAPKIGKNALLFCTFSGPHTGMNEAVPAVKYMGQFFEHVGFNIVDEWYILSEFFGSLENNTQGRMGDIRGLPNQDDLIRLETSAYNLAVRLS